jgi:DNA-binding transcriptional LysR family regulator
MIIDNLNLNLLRVFEAVYRLQSMTKAATELHMTQSGVSQNIKNLEEVLEVVLFDRIKQRPVPTDKANTLYQKVHQQLDELEDTLLDIVGVEQTLRGKVVIGVPIEYGNNMIVPILAQWGLEHPAIEFQLYYGHASTMHPSILDGQIDFAFVDHYRFDKQMVTEEVGHETLCLCASAEYLAPYKKVKKDLAFFEQVQFISYMDTHPVLGEWFKHHYGQSSFNGKVRASMMDVQGVAKMITQGFGLGVLPLYLIKKLEGQGDKLTVFKGTGAPLINPISMVYLSNRHLSPAARSTMEYLKKALAKRG